VQRSSAICAWESHCAKVPSVATMRNPPGYRTWEDYSL
jgi:hypothetical protein